MFGSGFRLIAGRETTERLRSRAIWIGTVITALVVAAAIVIPHLVSGGPATPVKVGLVGVGAQKAAAQITALARASGQGLSATPEPSLAAARSDLRRGTITVALEVTPKGAIATIDSGGGSVLRAFSSSSLPASVQATLEEALFLSHATGVLTSAGLPPAIIRQALAPRPFTVTSIGRSSSRATSTGGAVAAVASAILLYVFLAIYGQAVVSGVAQEKTSRVAEILLGAVDPVDLLTGKVAGIGVVGALQLFLVVGVGLGASALTGTGMLPPTIWAALPSVLLWFILGYALYGFAYAAAGAMVTRQEDIQFAATPISIVMVLSYVLVYLMASNPTAPWAPVVALLPPFAPVLQPARVALGLSTPPEFIAAIVFTLAAAWGIARLAARMYAPALTSGGARLTWRFFLRGGRE